MERRKDQRFPVRSWASYGIPDPTELRILDVSASGCALETPGGLGETGTVVRFQLPLPGRYAALSVTAKIVWTAPIREREPRPFIRQGLRFVEMDARGELILAAYLDFLGRDITIAKLSSARRKIEGVREQLDIAVAEEERKTVLYLH
ncbi:MAG: PilZ domain-containing protein [bacterium]